MKNFKLLLIFPALLLSVSPVFGQKNSNVNFTTKNHKGEKADSLKDNKLSHFIQFGIMSKNHKDFKNKYHVDVIYENCVITPVQSQLARENNMNLARKLTEKYGEIWKKDLEITPYGL